MDEDGSQTSNSEEIPSQNREFKLSIQRAIKETKRKLRGLWTNDDTLIERFFPVGSAIKSRIAAVKLQNYNQSTRRWKTFPEVANDVVGLASPLWYLLNDFILESSKV